MTPRRSASPFLGILMLDTRFPRLRGDIGRPDSFATLDAPGVLTADAASLTPAHLLAVNADPGTPVAGLEPGCALQRTLLEDLPTLDAAQAERDTVAAARRLVEQHSHIRSIVLECTNLPPYADAVRSATGRPVQHLISLLHERWQS